MLYKASLPCAVVCLSDFHSFYAFLELVVVHNAFGLHAGLVGIDCVYGIIQESGDLLAVVDAQTYQSENPHL